MNMRRFLFLIFICLCGACTSTESETAQQTEITAQIPKDWHTEQLNMPGTRILIAREDPDKTDTSPHLLWLQASVYGDIDPESIVSSMRQHSDTGDVQLLKERKSHLAYSVEYENESTRSVYHAYRTGRKIRVLAFLAPTERFQSLGGSELPLETFDDGTFKPLLEADHEAVSQSDNTVLASANGYELSQKMLTDTLAFAEFLATSPLDLVDRKYLRNVMIADFESITGKDFKTYQDISRLMESLEGRNGISLAKIRRDTLNRIYFDMQQSRDSSPLMDVVYKYNPVLGADNKLKLIATRSGYEALLDTNSFILSVAGLGAISNQQREQYIQEIVNEYDSLNDKGKRFLADGEVNSAELMQVWHHWDKAKRDKNLRMSGAHNVKQPEEIPQVARNLEALAGIDNTMLEVEKFNKLLGGIMTLNDYRNIVLD